MKNLFLFFGLLLTPTLFAQTTYSATDSVMVVGSNVSPGNDWGRGFEFIPINTLYVTHVGKRVPTPATYNYTIRIWDYANQTLVYEQVVNNNIPDQYTYLPVTAPVTLNAGVSYAITLYGNGPYFYETNSQVNSNLTYQTMRYCNLCPGLDFPTYSLSGYHYGTPDFLFTLVPPCATYATFNETACESFTSPSGNYTWTTSGTYNDTIPNAAQCDSIMTFNLTVNSNSYNMLSEVACNSYTSPSGSYTWMTSGTYMDTLPSTNGCDSVLAINLIVNNSASSSDIITSCGPITWMDGMTYTSSNSTAIYSLIGGAANGCDSIITLNLTITDVDVSTSVSGITITSNGIGTYQWIDCNNSNAWIPGATNASFTPVVNGDYAVIVMTNNCVDTSACVAISTIGLDELEGGVFSIAPNPTQGVFTVQINKGNEAQGLDVVDMMGRSVFTATEMNQEMQIDLSSEKRGVYFVVVYTGSSVHVEKVVLQ